MNDGSTIWAARGRRSGLHGGILGLVLGLALLSLAACTAPRRPLVVGPTSPGGAIILAYDQELEVNLPTDPKSGNVWEITSDAAPVIRPLGTPTFKAGASGGAGTTTFRFRVYQWGRDRLEIVYRRPGDAITPPADVFARDIDIPF